MNNQNLLDNILELSEQYCGTTFKSHIIDLKHERERYLNNIWNSKDYKSLIPEVNIKNSTRRIDFDTIIYFAEKKLQAAQYVKFIDTTIKMALEAGEMEYSKELIHLLLKNYVEQLSKEDQAKIYHYLGEIALYQNDFDQAHSFFDNSLGLYTELKDPAGLADVHNSLGIVLVEKGEYTEGHKLFETARKIALSNNIQDIAVKCDINLGNYYYIIGDIDKALDKYFSVKEHAIKESNASLLGKVFINISSSYKQKKDYQKALVFLAKAEEVIENIDNKFLKALYYLVKGEILIHNEEYHGSMAMLTSSFTIFSEIGDKLSIADTYRALGILFSKKGNEKVAISYLENSAKINQQGNNHLNLGETYIAMAEHYYLLKQTEQAKVFYQKAIECFSLFNESHKVTSIKQIIDKF